MFNNNCSWSLVSSASNNHNLREKEATKLKKPPNSIEG